MIRFLATLILLLCANMAAACSCSPRPDAGFVHAQLKRLPANARGALFLPPPLTLEYLSYDGSGTLYQGEISAATPDAFSITSDTQPGLLPAAFSWPNVKRRKEPTADNRKSYRFAHQSDEQKYLAAKHRPSVTALLADGKLVDISDQLHDAQRLMRVAPAEGFKPGAHYTIRYNKQTNGWAYPDKIEFSIDDTTLAPADLDIRLQLDGLPQQQMLALATGKGSCSRAQPVSTQAFSYTTTAALQPYSDGITYFAESRPTPDGEFAEVRYETSLCGERDFGTTAKQHGQDLIYTDCDDNDSPRILRGWAGFLEVEDELHLAGTQNIDLGSATGHVCTGFNMLKKALINRDKQHIRDIACNMPLRYDGEYYVPPDGPPHAIALADLPPLKDLFQFSDEGNADDQGCVRRVLWRLIIEAPTATQTGAEKLGELLAALPPEEREHKILAINDLLNELDTLQDRRDALLRLNALVKPLLPTLRETAKLTSPAAKAARTILKRSKN